MSDAAARAQTDTETGAGGRGLRVPFSGHDDKRPAPTARVRLAKLVAFKLALDLAFVGAFALYTHASTFRGGFDGALEHADGRGARGWVADLDSPGGPVEVQLYLDGRFAAAALAVEPAPGGPPTRSSASTAGGRRAFVFEFEPPRSGEFEARVYAVRVGRGGERRTLHEIGGARRFDLR